MKNNDLLQSVERFKSQYPSTVAWRIKSHCKAMNKHLSADEKIVYAFAGQANNEWYNMMHTAVVAITNKRLLITTDRLLFGYFFKSITPEMFNDLNVYSGLFWGKVIIDTIKEVIVISNIDKKALEEIQNNITSNLMKQKEETKKTLMY